MRAIYVHNKVASLVLGQSVVRDIKNYIYPCNLSGTILPPRKSSNVGIPYWGIHM
jgi:hypothetical protein